MKIFTSGSETGSVDKGQEDVAKKESGFYKKIIVKISGGLFFLLVWYLLSCFDDSALILPSPLRVLRDFFVMVLSSDFWSDCGFSFLRCFSAFLISAFFAFIAGLWWGLYPFWRDFFSFFLNVIKSTPVIALILLSVFWFGAGFVPVFAGFLMSFPVITEAIIGALDKFPLNMVEVCREFRLNGFSRLFKVYIPYITLPFLNAANTSLGIVWKVVVAGEVISIPGRGVGASLVESKNQIDISGVFSSALAVVVFCWITAGLFSVLIKRFKPEKYVFPG